MFTRDAAYYIEQLKLVSHPEGGHFASSYFGDEKIKTSNDKSRNLFTSIYFLLKPGEVSHFHRLQSDELWYFHDGSPLTVHIISPEGDYNEYRLGLDLVNGQKPQVKVPKGSIFGSSVDRDDNFSLVGCMVSPGFDFEDFELFTQSQLLEAYPQHEEIILKLAYESSNHKETADR